MQSVLPPRAFRAAQALVLSGSIVLLGVVATLVIFYVMASPTFGWTGAPCASGLWGLAYLVVIFRLSRRRLPSSVL